jgi:hypothetical protein
MPYAALHPDCDSLTDPDAADLARIAAESAKPGLIVFGWRFPDLPDRACCEMGAGDGATV